MKLSSIRDPETWGRRAAMLRKYLSQYFMKHCDSKPIFVMGMQRSGTSMLMRAFHRHREVLVIDEHKDNAAFENYCLRDIDQIHRLVTKSRFPYICFKPICDSHRISHLQETFSDGQFIWIYRDFKDVANSYIRKFDAPTRAIQLVCNDQPGAGWFGDGITPEMLRDLKSVYSRSLTEFELSCLVWWSRNKIILDSGLAGNPNVVVLKYETLVSEPSIMLRWLFQRLQLNYAARVEQRISTRSIQKNAAPEIDANVSQLCMTMAASLNRLFYSQLPPCR